MNKRNQVLLLLIIVIIALPSYLIYDYTQNNPKFCTTCHLMNNAYDTWEISAMHDLNCHECHETDMVESMGHVVEVIFEDPKNVTKITEVENELCIHCHASNDYTWNQIINTEGHRVHFFENKNQPYCISCHGLNLHLFEPPFQICQDCHNVETWMDTSEYNIHCVDCHEFSVRDLYPESGDCINCHDFARTKTVMAESKHQSVKVETYCLSCHNPHTEEIYEDCENCHTEEPKGLHNVSAHQSCAICHSPHMDQSFREKCIACHKNKETHYSLTKCEICHSFIY